MSVEASNVEHMFEGLADADLVDAMTSSAREENAACARRLVAIGVLDARRARELADCNLWRTDPWEEVAAEVSAALNIGRGRASGLIGYARALRDKLPAVAAVFATGAIDFRMMMTIVSRTATVDDEVMGRLDTALARHVPKWMRLSGPKLADRIDLWVGVSRTWKGVRCRESFVKRCCAGDEGLSALRSRPAGGGFKPPHAALSEDASW